MKSVGTQILSVSEIVLTFRIVALTAFIAVLGATQSNAQSNSLSNSQSNSQSTGSRTPSDIATNGLKQLFDRSSGETPDSVVENPLDESTDFFLSGPERWTSPEGLSSSLQVLMLLTVISLAPAILLMTTCYIRIIVVLGLLRQALGTNQLPPSQVITSIALFMTVFIMSPVWNQVYTEAIVPYSDPESGMGLEEAWEIGVKPVRDFMSRQIDMAGNHGDVLLFYEYYQPDGPEPSSFDDVPLRVLMPAYMLSELKIAFAMGFQIFLPFLILDVVIASVTISMGMMMLPPAMISLPFKLMFFVLVDGWHLVVMMLLESFGTFVS